MSLVVAIVLGVIPPGPVNEIPEPGVEPLPPARPHVDMPKPSPRVGPIGDGTARLAAGVTLGLLGLAGHGAIVGGMLAAESRRSEEVDPTTSEDSSCSNCGATIIELIAWAATDPFVAAGLALTGSGAAARARWLVHHGRRVELRRAVGWSLFGVGAALWFGGRMGGAFGCPTTRCTIGVMEGAYWVGAPLLFTGIALGGRASGAAHQRRRERESRPRVESVAFGPRGLMLSGRF